MLRPQFLSAAARTARVAPRLAQQLRPLSNTAPLRKEEKESEHHDPASTSGVPGESGAHEGQFARTDESISVEYPEDNLPRSRLVEGRGGPHFKKTLASFSMEGRTAVITGGARGLGLVMAQALAQSGADLALVDLNGESLVIEG